MHVFIKRKKQLKGLERKVRVLDRKIRRAGEKHERTRERHLEKERAADEKAEKKLRGKSSTGKRKGKAASPRPQTVAA
jgi:hypothetical protein